MVFVPGNHDEFAAVLRPDLCGIEIKRETIHTAADGKRYLIMHGDEFDVVVRTRNGSPTSATGRTRRRCS